MHRLTQALLGTALTFTAGCTPINQELQSALEKLEKLQDQLRSQIEKTTQSFDVSELRPKLNMAVGQVEGEKGIEHDLFEFDITGKPDIFAITLRSDVLKDAVESEIEGQPLLRMKLQEKHGTRAAFRTLTLDGSVDFLLVDPKILGDGKNFTLGVFLPEGMSWPNKVVLQKQTTVYVSVTVRLKDGKYDTFTFPRSITFNGAVR